MSITIEPETWSPYVVINNANWSLYQQLLRVVGEQNLRLTFDEGVLEIMSPLPEHERVKKVFARLLETMSLELNIPISSYGSTTFKRKSLQKGLEPDECYYVQNEREMRNRKRIDLKRDPPPDLVLEVNISYHIVDKRRVYAAMGVPELWSYDDAKLECLHLKRGKYESRDQSLAFPFLRTSEMQRFLKMLDSADETTVLRAWRDWVRKNLPVHE
jgi:Uma2 family endonuclease